MAVIGLLRQINAACEQNNTELVAQLVKRFPEKPKWWRFSERDDQHVGSGLMACAGYNNRVIFEYLKPIIRQHVTDQLHIKTPYIPGKPYSFSLCANTALHYVLQHSDPFFLTDFLELCPFPDEALSQSVYAVISKGGNFQQFFNILDRHIVDLNSDTRSRHFDRQWLQHACLQANVDAIDFLYNPTIAEQVLEEFDKDAWSVLVGEGFNYLKSKQMAQQQCQAIWDEVRDQSSVEKIKRKM